MHRIVDGEVYVYGANDASRLSTSSYDNKIKFNGKFVDISVSESHVLALTGKLLRPLYNILITIRNE